VTEGRAGAAVWVATFAGAGFFPVAPGTLGSAIGVGLSAALGQLRLALASKSCVMAGVALGLGAAGIWAAGKAEHFFGHRDPGPVVIDEVVGQMLVFLARPGANWKWLLTGFLLFRALDVLKPFPARHAERLPRGWGIMMDDVVSGLYSLGILTAASVVTK